MQERVGRKGNPPTLLVGLKIDKAIVKKQYGESLKKIKIELPYDSTVPLLSIYPEKIHFSSVTQSCPNLDNPMQPASPPCLPPTPKSTQTHVHWVSDAIQPSHLLSSPSPPAFNLFQHQSLFQWVSSSHQVANVFGVSASASVLPMKI